MNRIVRLAISTLALLTSLGISGAVLEPAAFADEADDLFTAGNAAYKAQHYDEAYDKLSRAWKARQTFDIAANLALVERQLGKKRDAAEHFAYALRVFPVTGQPESRTRLQNTLAEIEREVGRVVVQVPPNTIIQVDGVVVGTSPLPGTLYVEPGTRVIVGEHPTLGKARVEMACAQGKEVTVMLDLHPTEGTVPVVPPTKHRSIAPAIVGYGIGVAGLGVGGALLAVHGGQVSDAKDLGKATHCSRANASTSCPAVDHAVGKANTTGNASVGMFVVGGVGVAAGTALLIWALTGGEPAKPAKAAFVPLVSPQFAGGQLDLQF